jgi:hypothetical protein
MQRSLVAPVMQDGARVLKRVGAVVEVLAVREHVLEGLQCGTEGPHRPRSTTINDQRSSR